MQQSPFKRHVNVLREIASRPDGCSVPELVSLLGIPDQTVRRDLADLEEVGWIERDRSRWILSSGFGEMFMAHARQLHARVRAVDQTFKDFFRETLRKESDHA